MKVKVNGVEIPLDDGNIHIEAYVDPGGEVMPFLMIDAVGGKLDVYRSRYSTTGNISFHLFGMPEEDKS